MNKPTITRHKPLTSIQLDLLLTLYIFRFSTRPLVARYFNRPNNTSLYSKLSILKKHELIDIRFDSSYKLAGRPAEYYVTPKGLRALRDYLRLEVNESAVQAIYKDKTVGDQFVRRTLTTFALRNQFTDAYKTLKLFTKRDMQPLGYFPKQLPDAYITFKTPTVVKRFFLEYVPADTPTIAIDRRLRHLIAYYENDGWNVSGMPFPAILCVCENGATERRVTSQIRRALDRVDTDMLFYTTTLGAALSLESSSGMIWTTPDDSEELRSLDTLFVR